MDSFSYFLKNFHFFGWQDGLEIFFFSVIFYFIAQWLKKDKNDNLLIYFYGYSLFAFVTYALHLSTITYFLFLFTPVIIMIFIVAHQETLQRNIIALKNKTNSTMTGSGNWLEELLRFFLVMQNSNKELTCIIEYTDSIQPFIHTSCKINAHISNALLNLIEQSSLFEREKITWVTSSGLLVAVNATWKNSHASEIDCELPWKETAILYTSKLDSLIIHLSNNTSLFTIIINGKLIHELNAHQALQIIKKHIKYPILMNEKGVLYGTTHKKPSLDQRSP